MAYIIDLDYQRLLDFANGYTICGETIVASTTPIIDVGPALAYCAANGWTVMNIIGQPGRVTYYLTSASASTATNTEPYAGHEGEYASPAGINTGTNSLSGNYNIPEYGVGASTPVESNTTAEGDN